MDCDNNLESNWIPFPSPRSQITPFIAQITNMLKKPTIEADLNKVLQEFASKLDDCEKHLNSGIASVNFAEIALLIQNSANLYSKKVDILWDFILDYQQRLISKENNVKENEIERDKLEERKRKYKRRRKTNVNNSEISTIIENFSFASVSQPCESFDYLSGSGSLERSNLEQKWQKFDSSTPPKADSHGMRHDSQLFLPVDAIYSEDGEYIGRYNQFHSTSCLSKTSNSSTSTPLTSFNNNNNNYIKEMRPVSCCSRRLSFESCKLPFIVLKPLSDEVLAEKLHRPLSSSSEKCQRAEEEEEHLRKKLRRMSLADSLLDNNENFSEFEDEENEDSLSAPPIEKRNKSISQESGFFEDLDETVSSKSLGRSRIVLQRERRAKLERIVNKSLKTKSPRKQRVSRKLIERLSQGVSSSLSEFEQFQQLHYKPSDGEGEKTAAATPLRTIPEESESAGADEDVASLPEAQSPLAREEIEETAAPEEVFRPPETLVEDSRRTVSDWRASILPRLKNAEKSKFDIHEYSESILKEIELGEEKLFKDVVKSKSRRDLNGYFLAALHLANTRNVEISGGQSGGISNDTFQLKVISKKRHHKELEEYQAPSSSSSSFSFSSRNSFSSNHSKSKEEPPRKRIKLTVRKIY